ncbi:MAG: CHAP domain-containing protein [Ktedonobacterales bacterium]|nr:CHAP domain-containing protein [Ktedonobacterales bacterium]
MRQNDPADASGEQPLARAKPRARRTPAKTPPKRVPDVTWETTDQTTGALPPPAASAGRRRTLASASGTHARPDDVGKDTAPSASTSQGTETPPRRATGRQRAQPIRPEDRALVERATLAMHAHKGKHAVAPNLAPNLAPAIWQKSTAQPPVTVVAGDTSGRHLALPPRAPRHRRGVFAGVAACVLCVAAITSVLYTLLPVGTRSPAQLSLALNAAAIAQNPSNANGTAWSTSAGALSLGVGGGAGPGVKAPGSAGLPVTTPPQPSGPPTNGIGVSPAPFTPWPPSSQWMMVPGRYTFSVQRPADNYYGWAFGQCTWWSQYERRDENLTRMGNALSWAGVAATRGYTVSARPAPNTTVTFQPGVQGAGGAGHVAHVVAVYPGGWFLMSEMNFYWNGGGWGRVDYRYAHSGWGVQFIY